MKEHMLAGDTKRRQVQAQGFREPRGEDPEPAGEGRGLGDPSGPPGGQAPRRRRPRTRQV